MQHRILGLYGSPWECNFKIPRERTKSIWQTYRWAVWFKANPRSEEYMHGIFSKNYPNGEFINVDHDKNWRELLPKADTIVLLYPDAVGLRFYSLEKKVMRMKKEWTAVRALNGRCRDFLLNRATLRGLRLRRIMEHTMLGEVFAILLFVCITPILLAVDWARGKM